MVSFKTAPMQHCLQLIVSLCDGASKRDGYGFNRFDAEYGHQMATIAEVNWSTEDKLKVYYLLRKYQRQLKENGINFYQDITKPEVEVTYRKVDLSTLGRI